MSSVLTVWDSPTYRIQLRDRKRRPHGRRTGPRRWQTVTLYTHKPTGKVYRSYARLNRATLAHENGVQA